MTFPGGTHDLWIRYWLAAGGIDPDRDIETIVVPPAQMVANMKVGTMDCFCVCEPWNHQLINQKIGYTAHQHRRALEQASREGLRHARRLRRQVSRKPRKALLTAVMEAQMWCDKDENRAEVAAICAKRQWINCPVGDVTDRMKGKFDYGIPGKVVENSPHIMKYWRDQASYPFQSHDLWFLTENIRWGKLEANFDTDRAHQEGESRRHVARGRQDSLRARVGHPHFDVTRQGNVLRRQGLRPGRSERVSEQPLDEAHDLNLSCGAGAGPAFEPEHSS